MILKACRFHAYLFGKMAHKCGVVTFFMKYPCSNFYNLLLAVDGFYGDCFTHAAKLTVVSYIWIFIFTLQNPFLCVPILKQNGINQIFLDYVVNCSWNHGF